MKKEYRGKGYATEGVKSYVKYISNCLNVNEIFVKINKENMNSKKVIQHLKIGLVEKHRIVNNHIVYKLIGF